MIFVKKIFLALASFVVFLVLLIATHSLIAPQIREADTVYTDGYSHEKFSQIRAGMTKNEVFQLCGEPFYRESENFNDWQYSKTGKLNSKLRYLVGGNYVRVIFDEDDKVKGTVRWVF